MAEIEQIMKEALSLPSASRAWLAEKLVESLEFDVDEDLQARWTNVLPLFKAFLSVIIPCFMFYQ